MWCPLQVPLHCRKKKKKIPGLEQFDDMRVQATNETHDIIAVLCVENVYVGVNTCVTLWSDPLTEAP